ncbi:MAG: hypothetical protein ACXWAC_02340 [Usitatibacter sp.]
MNAKRAPAADSEAGMQLITCRISRARDLGGCLAVTVATSRLLHVRRAIVQSGCESVGIVKATPLACGTRVRLLIAARPESFACIADSIRHALEERDADRAGMRRAA